MSPHAAVVLHTRGGAVHGTWGSLVPTILLAPMILLRSPVSPLLPLPLLAPVVEAPPLADMVRYQQHHLRAGVPGIPPFQGIEACRWDLLRPRDLLRDFPP